MTFIDWSDSESVVGLLVEFVADERKECVGDEERERFLADLLRELTTIEERISAMPAIQAISALRDVRDGIAGEFSDDPVVGHIENCIEEIERVNGDDTA